MKAMKLIMVFTALLFSFWATGLYAADEKPEHKVEEQKGVVAHTEAPPAVTGTASLSVLNKYIFRGYEINRGSFVVQPYTSVSYKGFSVSFWGNVDSRSHGTPTVNPAARNMDGKREWNETDLTLSYTYTAGKCSLTGGWIYYALKYADETEELFLSGTYDMLLKPTLAVYQDYRSYPGTYVNFSVGHSIKVYKENTLDLAASWGYERGKGSFWQTYSRSAAAAGNPNPYTGSVYRAPHDGMVKAGFTIPVTAKVSLQPFAQYWYPLSSKASRTIDGNPYNPNGNIGTVFVTGLTAAYNF